VVRIRLQWLFALRARVGRRGAALLAFGFLDCAIGWSLLDSQSQTQVRAAPAYRAIVAAAPLPVWAWLWLAVGVLCAGQAFARRDRWGYTAAIIVMVLWAGGFATAWLVYRAQRAWVGAATWAVLAGLVSVCAGWPEPAGRDDAGR
jgi:hypothetical protein